MARPSSQNPTYEPRSIISRHGIYSSVLNARDDYHHKAKQLLPRIRFAAEVWITKAICAEVGNALSAFNRKGVVQFIQQCYRTENVRVVSVDTAQLMRALELYQSRTDKT